MPGPSDHELAALELDTFKDFALVNFLPLCAQSLDVTYCSGFYILWDPDTGKCLVRIPHNKGTINEALI